MIKIKIFNWKFYIKFASLFRDSNSNNLIKCNYTIKMDIPFIKYIETLVFPYRTLIYLVYHEKKNILAVS